MEKCGTIVILKRLVKAIILSAMPTEINLTPTASPFEIATGAKTITGRTWGTPSGSRAAALLVHGIGAHSGWFEALARRLKVKHIYALAYDQIGFGKRRDQKFTSCEQWLDDVATVYAYLKEQVGDKPIYLMGNSMGGVVAHCAAPVIEPTGLVLFSPGYAGYPGTFTLPFRVKALLRANFFPDSEIDLPYTTDIVIRDESARSWIENDPERRFRIPARMLSELLQLTKQVPQKADLIKSPTLVITAGTDKIVDNRTIASVFERLAASKKKRRHFVESYHDLMCDPAIDDVTAEVVDWISQTLQNVEVQV